MDSAYRKYLELHMADLCERMEPGRVASRLAKHGVFVDYDLQILASKVTTIHKNEHIVNALMERGFAAITKFLCILASIDHTHYELAKALQPIKKRIIWFSPSPANAAAVVYTLEKYAGAKFSGMKRVGKDKALVERRARIFPVEYDKDDYRYSTPPLDVEEVVRNSHKTEVRLLFPATPLSANAETVFKSWFMDETLLLEADMMLLSGVTVRREGGGGGEGRRRVVVGTRCLLGDEEVSAGVSEAQLESLKTTLAETLNSHDDQPLWVQDLKDCLPELKFGEFQCQVSIGNSQEAVQSTPASRGLITTDPMPFSFYKSCQEMSSKKRNLVCYGEHTEECPPVEGERDLSPAQPQESESKAAVRCSCILMEVCRHYYGASTIDQQSDSDDD